MNVLEIHDLVFGVHLFTCLDSDYIQTGCLRNVPVAHILPWWTCVKSGCESRGLPSCMYSVHRDRIVSELTSSRIIAIVTSLHIIITCAKNMPAMTDFLYYCGLLIINWLIFFETIHIYSKRMRFGK